MDMQGEYHMTADRDSQREDGSVMLVAETGVMWRHMGPQKMKQAEGTLP